ncbi:MAG: hypothetical protein IJ673_05170, partial [Treponema sp.]|nr:hypothetical protein [Treponema sp.]
NFAYMIYGFFVLLAAFLLCAFFFPIVYPLLHYKQMNKPAKRLFVFMTLFFIVAAAVIAYTITVREDLGRIAPRLHLRYVAPAFPVMFAVFFSLISRQEFRESMSFCSDFFKIAVFLIIFAFVFKGGSIGSPYDPMSLYWYINLSGKIGTLTRDNSIPIYAYAGVLNSLICFFVLLLHFLFTKKRKLAIGMLFTIVISASIYDSFQSAKIIRRDYEISDDIAASGNKITKRLQEEDANALIIADFGSKESRFFETYFDAKSRIYFCTEQDFSELKTSTAINKIQFFESVWHRPYQSISEIDYVVIPRTSSIEPNAAEVQKELCSTYFVVYRLKDSKYLSFKKRNLRTYIFGNNMLNNGYDKNCARHLNQGGFSFGPYWTLEKGNYTITIEGENLDKASIDIYSDYGKTHHPFVISSQSTNKIILDFTFEAEIENTEFFIQNNSEKELTMKSLILKQQ